MHRIMSIFHSWDKLMVMCVLNFKETTNHFISSACVTAGKIFELSFNVRKKKFRENCKTTDINLY